MANQETIAKEDMGVTKNHFNAVLNCRADAGYDLAKKASEFMGGTIEDWKYKDKGFDKYVRKARYRKYKAVKMLAEAEKEVNA